jgi:hypothetical protein
VVVPLSKKKGRNVSRSGKSRNPESRNTWILVIPLGLPKDDDILVDSIV